MSRPSIDPDLAPSVAPAEPVATLAYDIHGVRFSFLLDHPVVEYRIDSVLCHFRTHGHPGAAAVQVRIWSGATAAGFERWLEGGGWDLVATDSVRGCRLYQRPGAILADFGHLGGFAYDVARGRVEAQLLDIDSMLSRGRDRPGILNLILSEVLKRAGMYAIHAACVARDGLGLVLPGPSESGKTTSCIALLRGGFQYLGDDCVLLREGTDGGRLLCFPRRSRTRPRTVAFFPEIEDDRDTPSEVYAAPVIPEARPRFLVFPCIEDVAESRLDRMSRAEALRDLLPNTLVVHDPRLARAHFDALAAMVRRMDCYRLRFGRDVLSLPERIGRLFATAD